MDYQVLAKEILQNLGESNITNAGHCVTRLRVTCKDVSIADQDKLKSLEGVQGTVIRGNEIQVIIGTEVSEVYREFIKLGAFSKEGKVNEEGKSSLVNRVIKYISASIYPVLPALTAAALVGALCTILTTFAGLSTESGTYTILNTIYSALFDFLPVFVGFAAAKAMQLNPYLGALLGALLVHGNINGAEGLDFLGIPVTATSYGSTILPVLLGVAFMALVDKYVGNYVPKVVSFFFRPLVDILITLPVTLIVLGPLGGIIGGYLGVALDFLHQTFGWGATAVLAAFSPLLIMTGMHTPLIPLGVQGFMQLGYDGFVIPAMLACNVAMGGAAIAVAVKTKKSDRKQAATSAGITGVVGISEPALFGICIPLKRPLYGAMIGGGIGGLFLGLTNVRMFGLNSPGIASLPLFVNPDGTMTNLLLAVAGCLIAFAAGFIATWLLGFDDEIK